MKRFNVCEEALEHCSRCSVNSPTDNRERDVRFGGAVEFVLGKSFLSCAQSMKSTERREEGEKKRERVHRDT